jgi:hypothetical protein
MAFEMIMDRFNQLRYRIVQFNRFQKGRQEK